ncbi:DUF2723 domain-containing protein [bacterium]|nr:DUF2723 domain-containing protein [bacterium]
MAPENQSKSKLPARIDWIISLALILLFLVVYFTWQTRLYNLDALISSWRISTSSWFDNFYPHHLMYIPLMSLFHNIWSGIFDVKTPVYSMQAVNSILGAITIGVCYIFALRLLKHRLSVLMLALAMGFSFTFWHWSTDADPYIPVNLLVIIALYILYIWNGVSKRNLVISALIFSFAILIHQMALVLILPALVLIYMRLDNRRDIRNSLVLFATVAIAPVIAGYVLVSEYFYAQSSFGGGLNFFFFHGSNPLNWIFLRDGFPEHLPAYIYHGILGHYNLFFFSAGPGRYEVFQPYAVDGIESDAFFRFILPVLVMLGSLYLLIRPVIETIRKPKLSSVFLLSWVLPLFVFLLLWNPGYSFHRIFYLFGFLVILFRLIEGFGERLSITRVKFTPVFQSLIVVSLLFYNLFVAIAPQAGAINEYSTAINLSDVLGNGDLVIATIDEEYLTRMIRCFTLSERMLEGDYPKAVPALGKISDIDIENLNEKGLSEIFDKIFVSKRILDKLNNEGAIMITYRVADDLKPREIVLHKGNWGGRKEHSVGNITEIEYKNT